jgi:TatD DNase family protein
MLIDSHCHLEFPEFADDLPAILARAKAAGIGALVTISTRIRRFEAITAIAEAHKGIYCSLGTHPHQAEEEAAISLEEIIALSQHPKVIAIGETGLDYFYHYAPIDTQHASFRRHLAACRQTDLPVIIHARDADADMLAILQQEGMGAGLRGVLHCFSSGEALAMACIEAGFYISFSGMLTFPKSQALREIAARIPLERLLVETDAPFLAPVPMRGKRNEPAFVAHTAATLARIKGVTSEDLARITTENFYRLFTRARREDSLL